MQSGPDANDPYKLILYLLMEYLDEPTAYALFCSSWAGYASVKEYYVPVKTKLSYYHPMLSLQQNCSGTRHLELLEASCLLKNRVDIVSLAMKTSHLLFNGKRIDSKYTDIYNIHELNFCFEKLQVEYDTGTVSDETLNKINTLIALIQMYMTNEACLSFVTRLTDEFCQVVQQAYPDCLKKLTIVSDHICRLSKEIGKFKFLEELKIIGGKLFKLDLLPEIAQCYLLKKISITNTRMKCLPEELSQLGSLCELVVSNNCLESLPDSLAKCSQLKSIDATDNPLIEISPVLADSTKINIQLGDPYAEFDSLDDTENSLSKQLGEVKL